MITSRPANERGHANHGWLDSHHSFSFANYYDPKHMGFSRLLVINEDRVSPGMGFGAHAHDNMEIISIVLSGMLEHQDSMGNRVQIRPGEVQRMSAGTGVRHSEYNASKTDPVHFLQIWIEPNQRDIAPSYEQKAFPEAERRGVLRLVASPDGADGSLKIHQDARLFVTVLEGGESATHALAAGRRAYVQVVSGSVTLNGQPFGAGDGARVEDEAVLTLAATERAEVLVFDLP